jgi:cobalt/nickel transport system permease protein
MGVLGAFVFAAQMINFAIPGTGSSGHLGGGLLLAILLGPHAAFLVMASILTLQSLFFGDGGLLALGCNIFNLGFFPAFVAYPLVYRPLARGGAGACRVAAVAAAVTALLAGAAAVVLQTSISGISLIPPLPFLLLMLPLHAVIGVVEGLVTAAVLAFMGAARPLPTPVPDTASLRPALILAGALLMGGILAGYASSAPDGLEWSLARVSEGREISSPGGGLHGLLASVQEQLTFFPDYDLPASSLSAPHPLSRPLAGVAGVLATLLLAGLVGRLLRRQSPRN